MEHKSDTTIYQRAFILSRKVFQGLITHHAFDHAATMSFYFFLGSIPLLVFAGLLMGSVLQREGAEALATPLYSAMPGAAADLFKSGVREISETRATSIAPLSFLGFLWLTTNGVHNLMDVFEILIGARPRPWWRQRAIATLWVAAVLGALAITTWILLIINGFAHGFDTPNHIPTLLNRVSNFLARGWQRIGVLVVFTVIASAGLAAFYRTAVVHPLGIRRHVWTGTFVALILWALVSWVFGSYVQSIGHYAIYYGSLATVAVILLWLYLTSLALVIGAEVNAQIEGVRGRSPSRSRLHHSKPPTRRRR